MDGPVVTVAEKALEQQNVSWVLPFVPKEGEQEVVEAFESGDPAELEAVLSEAVRHQVRHRLQRVLELKARANGDVERNREYVGATLGLQVWSHSLYLATLAQPHEHEHAHGHGE